MSTLTPNYKLEKPESTDYYDVNVQNRNWEKIDSELKDIDDKKADLGEDGKILSEQLPPMNYDPAGSAAAVQKNLDAHTSNKKNPHGVTADQVGADPKGSANAVKQSLEAHTGNKQNPHGVTAAQVGAYKKEEVMTKETSALFCLGSDAIPNDVLRLLGRFNSGLGNEYVWEKKKTVITYPVTFESQQAISANRDYTMYYSDEIEYDPFYTRGVRLKNPVRYTYNRDTVENLVGKYYTTSNIESEGSWVYKITRVYSIYNSNASLDAEPVKITEQVDVTPFGYVNSPESNAYPPSVSDGYEYVPLGQIGDKACIVTGSYVGDGQYGEENANQLEFPQLPKVVFIVGGPGSAASIVPRYAILFCNTSGNNVSVGFTFAGGGNASAGSNITASQLLGQFAGNVAAWYSNSAQKQLNEDGVTYNYYTFL